MLLLEVQVRVGENLEFDFSGVHPVLPEVDLEEYVLSERELALGAGTGADRRSAATLLVAMPAPFPVAVVDTPGLDELAELQIHGLRPQYVYELRSFPDPCGGSACRWSFSFYE